MLGNILNSIESLTILNFNLKFYYYTSDRDKDTQPMLFQSAKELL